MWAWMPAIEVGEGYRSPLLNFITRWYVDNESKSQTEFGHKINIWKPAGTKKLYNQFCKFNEVPVLHPTGSLTNSLHNTHLRQRWQYSNSKIYLSIWSESGARTLLQAVGTGSVSNPDRDSIQKSIHSQWAFLDHNTLLKQGKESLIQYFQPAHLK